MLEVLVTSSVLILTVLAVRAVFGGKLGLRVRYALWAVALLRLLLPFPLAASPVSVMNVVEAAERRAVAAASEKGDQPGALSQQSGAGGPGAVIPGDRVASGIPETSGKNLEGLPVWEGDASAEQSPAPEAGIFQDAGAVWKLVWLAGTLITAACILFSNLRFWRGLKRRAQPVELPDFPLPVYRAAGLPSPCLYGLFRPAVYLTPESMEEERRLRHILAHEYAHFRHGDHLWSLARGLCLAAYWFDPLVWLAAVLSRRDGELACDEGALARLGEEERTGYGRTLVELIGGKRGSLLCGATTMTSAGKSLKTRLEFILRKPRRTIPAVCAAAALLLAAAGCAFTGASPSASAPDPEEGILRKIDWEDGVIAYGPAGEEPTVIDVREVPVTTEDGKSWTLSALNLDDRIRVSFQKDGTPEAILWTANPLSMREEPDLDAEEVRSLALDLYREQDVLNVSLKEGDSVRQREIAGEEDADRYGVLLEKYRWYRCNAPDMVSPGYEMRLATGSGKRQLVFYGLLQADGLFVRDKREDGAVWYCARRAVDTVPASAAQALREEFEQTSGGSASEKEFLEWDDVVPAARPLFSGPEIKDGADAGIVVQQFLEERVESVLARDPDSADAAEDVQWVWCTVEAQEEDFLECTYQLAVKPKHPARYPWAGRMRQGTGEYEGYAVCSYRAALEWEDGMWRTAARTVGKGIPGTTTGQLSGEKAAALFEELWDSGDPEYRVTMADGTSYSHSVDPWYNDPAQLGAVAAFYQWTPEEAPAGPEDWAYQTQLISGDGRASLTLYEGSDTALWEREGEKAWVTLLPCQKEFVIMAPWRLFRLMFDSTVPYPVTEASIPVKEGEDLEDTAKRYLQEVFQHWNDRRAPGDCNRIEDFVVVETDLGDGSLVREDAFVFHGAYSLKPEDYENTELWIASGKDDPDRPGWIRDGMQFRLKQADGQWKCTSYGGGVGLE